jgi:predicted ATPase
MDSPFPAGSNGRPELGVFGRESPLSHLQEAFERALRGRRQVVFITGEPGIGKTSLVGAFVERVLAQTEMMVARGQCVEHYGEREAYYPMLEALSHLSRQANGAVLTDVLAKHAPTWLVQLPWLVTPGRRQALQRETLGATRERMLREISRALEELTAETPLALVLEDLHWSDYSTVDLLSAVARGTECAHLLVLGTYRPVEVILGHHPLKSVTQELQMHALCEELPLELLTEADVAAYLAARFPQSGLADSLARVIYSHTEGNPLFMVSAVDDMLARGLISARNGCWELTVPTGNIDLGVPESLQQIVEKQIDRLSDLEREVLEAASTAGMQFSAWVVSAGLGADAALVEDCCESLARRHDLIRSAGLEELHDGSISARYEFMHSLYREVLYGRQSPLRRVRLHQRIGERTPNSGQAKPPAPR